MGMHCASMSGMCVQEPVQSPAHGSRPEHGEVQLMCEHHAQWSEHLPVCACVPRRLWTGGNVNVQVAAVHDCQQALDSELSIPVVSWP